MRLIRYKGQQVSASNEISDKPTAKHKQHYPYNQRVPRKDEKSNELNEQRIYRNSLLLKTR